MPGVYRVISSEYRDPDHGDGLSLVKQIGGRKSGANRQKAHRLNKPGPKPEHGFSLDARLRKIKSRCKKRGVPFILAQYLKPKESLHMNTAETRPAGLWSVEEIEAGVESMLFRQLLRERMRQTPNEIDRELRELALDAFEEWAEGYGLPTTPPCSRRTWWSCAVRAKRRTS